MARFKRKFNHAKDKFSGKVKETTGRMTGNEQLELKGKIQSAQADIKKDMTVSDRINDIKENIAGKINDKIDKQEDKKAK
ncbi:MAG: CsbD family protein [Clostridiaceae bacterium]|nr:CsbD family protein [Clostridiaceae bacterium]